MTQFSKGDLVLYGSNGVCRIDDIEPREQDDYYILYPVHKQRTRLMVPVHNAHLMARMRSIPSAADLKAAMHTAFSQPIEWIDDTSARKESAKEILARGNEGEVLSLMRTFYLHRQAAIEAGRKSTLSDKSILKEAEQLIFDEFSVVFQLEPEEVSDLISAEASAARA